MNENAKCPFCKSISFDVLTVQKRGNSNIRYQAYCQTCGATGPTSSDKEIAMLAWESPSPESALLQRAEKAEATLREIEVELRIIREASNVAKTDLMVSIGNNVSEPIGKLIIKAWETLNGK